MSLVAEIVVLGQAAAVLTWDQQTNIPPGSAEARANRLSYLGKLAQEKAISPEIGKLLEELLLYVDQINLEWDEARFVTFIRLVAKRK